jgi:hypothetical protein
LAVIGKRYAIFLICALSDHIDRVAWQFSMAGALSRSHEAQM